LSRASSAAARSVPGSRRATTNATALDPFVYAHAALHGLVSKGLRLNEEVEGVADHVGIAETYPGSDPVDID